MTEACLLATSDCFEKKCFSPCLWDLTGDGASYTTGTMLCVDGGGSYTALSLIDIEDKAHLPVYGKIPAKAKL